MVNICFLPATALARGGGGCLAKGTPISTPRGPVPIEQLHAGDQVWTVLNGRLCLGTVQAKTEVEAAEFLELIVPGRTLRVTPEHPFQIAPGVFRLASCLKPGDSVYVCQAGSIRPTPIISLTRVCRRSALGTQHSALSLAYNLLVSPGGTYLADDVVVHNKGCFLPDTQILKADKTSISIRQIRPGDRLLFAGWNSRGSSRPKRPDF